VSFDASAFVQSSQTSYRHGIVITAFAPQTVAVPANPDHQRHNKPVVIVIPALRWLRPNHRPAVKPHIKDVAGHWRPETVRYDNRQPI
jgi:hypothetical protein